MAAPTPLRFNRSSGRYLDARGRFVSARDVQKALADYLQATTQETNRLGADIRAGRISLDAWRAAMRDHIKAVQLNSARIVKGGREAMTAADNGRVGAIVRREYGFLEQWVDQIKGGWKLDGRLEVRAQQYVNAAVDTFDTLDAEDWLRRGAEGLRDVVEKNVLSAAEHCFPNPVRGTQGCMELAALGWVAVGTLPPVKSPRRTCGRNCQCHIVRAFADQVREE